MDYSVERCSVLHVAPPPCEYIEICPQSRVLLYDNELHWPLRTLWPIELLNLTNESILATFHKIKQQLVLFLFLANDGNSI